MSSKIEIPAFPPTFEMNGRLFCARSRAEHHKRAILAAAMGAEPPEYSPPAVEEFVPIAQIAKELGVSRRTVGRRMVERSNSKSAAA